MVLSKNFVNNTLSFKIPWSLLDFDEHAGNVCLKLREGSQTDLILVKFNQTKP